jgi:hypothetical protein
MSDEIKKVVKNTAGNPLLGLVAGAAVGGPIGAFVGFLTAIGVGEALEDDEPPKPDAPDPKNKS